VLVEDAPRNLAAARALGLGAVGVYDESMAPFRAELLAASDVALERFGLFSRVDLVLTEEEAGSKRTSEPYALLAEKLGLAMPEMLLVEDAPRNIAAAADLGLGTVGVYDASMEAWQEELRRTADVYLPDFSDLSPVRGLLEKK
jgi:beta-phosphoglucomutase-like phosphatase (HAD superfamily)